MNEIEFVTKREVHWSRLAELCDQADSSPRNLGGASLQEFVELYRTASTDLAIIRGQASNPMLEQRLNQLVGRAYGVLYQAPRKPLGVVLAECLAAGARTMRKLYVFVLISVLLTVASGVVTSALLTYRPDLRAELVSAGEEPLFEHWKKGEFEFRSDTDNSQMLAMYATNNPMVSIMQVGLSAGSFGILGVKMGMNLGRQLGALSTDMNSVGRLGFFYSSIAAHGASELSGAFISMGAGLYLGWTLINPGRRPRGEALLIAGKDAFVLLVMSVIMMFIAAPFEAYFSFNPAFPQFTKTIVGAVVFAGWMFYWVGYARTPEEIEGGGRLARPARGAGGI